MIDMSAKWEDSMKNAPGAAAAAVAVAAAAVAAAVVVLCGALCGAATAVPLHPRTVQRLADYERLDEWIWIAEDAASRGIGVIPTGGPVISPARHRADVRILTLLVEFPDYPAAERDEPQKFLKRLFRSTEKRVMSPAGFFSINSNGALTITGEVFGWYAMPEPSGEYAGSQAGLGRYPSNALRLVEDALAAAAEISFEGFDTFGPGEDGDGVVDILLVLHSARGAELTGESDDLWSHAGFLDTPIERDGIRVEQYILAPSSAKLGLWGLPYPSKSQRTRRESFLAAGRSRPPCSGCSRGDSLAPNTSWWNAVSRPISTSACRARGC